MTLSVRFSAWWTTTTLSINKHFVSGDMGCVVTHHHLIDVSKILLQSFITSYDGQINACAMRDKS